MKNSKRIVTLILALVMIVSTMGISTMAATFSDITDERVGEAVAKLVANGIITGYEDGTFKPDNQITRAEFAAVVTRMKNVAGNLASDATTGFSDLDNDSSRAWARPYVKAAVDLGIINGFDDGTFRAGEPVTYEQAVKMLVCAAGYEIVAQSEYNKAIAANPNASWSAGYIAAANKHGFTKGAVTALISEPASRGVVALLTSNTIEVPVLQQNQDGSVGKGDASESEEKTIVEVKGIVSGTYYTGIDTPNAGISLKEIKILTTDNGEETYELSDELAKSLDFEDLIGKSVTAFYNSLDRQLTSITKSNNNITVIEEKDIIRPIEDGAVKYYNEKKKSSMVDLDDYTVIYNGKYLPEDSDIIEELNDNFKSGSIELVETLGRKFAKITSYDVYVVDSYSRSTGKITFKYGAGYYTFPSSSSDRPVVYVDGTKKEFDSLSLRAYNVINFMEAPEVGGNSVSKMYVTTKYYNGKVTAELDKNRVKEIGGKEIVLTNMYNDYTGTGKAPFSLGDSYKYYLDCTGQIAAIDYNPTTSSEYSLGYIIDADKDAVNLIKSDKTFEIVPLKERVKIDGTNVNDEDVKAKLEEIAGVLYDSDECSQPVKYIITNGELSAIDTAANADGELETEIGTSSDNTFIYNAGDTVKTSKSSIVIDGKSYQLSTSTMVIYVPEDTTKEAEYSIMAPSKAFASGDTREVRIFGANPAEKTKKATMVLLYGVDPAYDFIASTPYMIVSGVDRANMKITGYKEASSSKTTVTISEDKFKDSDLGVESVNFDDVDKGDVIRYIEDASGVIAIEMIYDASDEDLLYAEGPNGDHMYYQSYTSNVRDLKIRYAEAFDIDGSTFSVTLAMGGEYSEAEKLDTENNIIYPLNSSTTVYSFDEEGELVAEPSDAKYENISIAEGSCSEVIVFSTDSTNNTARVIYVVK